MHELLSGEAPESARGQAADALPRLRLRPGLHPLLALALALAGGILFSLAFPPAGLWPLAFVAPALLIVAIGDGRPGRGALLGLVFGFTGFGITVSWLLLFGQLAWFALTLLATLSTGLFGALLPTVRRPGRPIVTAATTAALWTAIDWLRGLWPLGGFTWGSLGVSQVSNHLTVRAAVVLGVYGVTFLVAFAAASLAAAVGSGRPIRGRLSAVGVALVAAVIPSVIPFSIPDGRPLDVAAIQVDFRKAVASRTREGGDVEVTRLNLDLHHRLWSRPPDLAIWGESALDPGSLRIVDEVRATIADVGVPVIAGSTSRDIRRPTRGPLFNQAVAFDSGGAVVDVYRKTHLVPYGEYIPWKAVVGWISALRQISYELAPGERVHTMRVPGLPPFGTPICFENSFPAIDRTMVREGARFLVVVTNNASYDETAASAQQLQMSRIRAIEDGRWVVHAAVSGISAFIGPDGRVHDQTELFRPEIIRHTIRASTVRTPYVALGDVVPFASLLAVIAMTIVPARGRRRSRPDPRPLEPGARTLVILPTYDEARTIRAVIDGVLSHPGVD
ncbi:MAG TPA: apolipoprotein N-acyltransferase, partial [Actinomycetota bacterium]|nr:apolipoprotein N-acyltransferase [Actinomycetota bacterium]